MEDTPRIHYGYTVDTEDTPWINRGHGGYTTEPFLGSRGGFSLFPAVIITPFFSLELSFFIRNSRLNHPQA
jgi:hypothetical protein